MNQTKRLNIVFIGFFNGFGGAQKQTVLVANAMADYGHKVSIISLGKYNQCFEIAKNIKVINIKDGHNERTRIISRFKQLKRILRQEKPDITISFWLQPIYLAAFIGKRITGKLLYSERCDPSDKQYTGLLGLLRIYSFRKVDGFVFQTTAAKNYFDERIRARSVVIPNPVFVNKKLLKKKPKANMGHTIVSVGRLHKQKNQGLLIDAFDLIKDDVEGYNLVIYGEGEEREHLERMIKDKNLDDRISLPGATSNAQKDIYGAALFVLSSDYEGMPNALLEAMSLRIPCISTNWAPGGVSDIIINNKNGIVVPANNSEELAKAILMLIKNKPQAKIISMNGSKATQQFKPEKIFSQWRSFIEETLR